MKRIYDIITKTNQVLLFFVLLGALVGIGSIIYSESHRGFETPNVPLARTADHPDMVAVRDVRLLGTSEKLYVFGIVKRGIAMRTKEGGTAMELHSAGGWGSRDEPPGEIVNVVFSNGERTIRALLPDDGLILDRHLSLPPSPVDPLNAFLFVCVTQDTNGDGRLDGRDRKDLRIVTKGLDGPDVVIPGMMDYEVISPRHVVVKTRDGDAFRFIDVNVETLEKTEVKWK
jgi:hypothetical protein